MNKKILISNSVRFYSRNRNAGVSIQRVFVPLFAIAKRELGSQSFFMPHRTASFIALARNMLFACRNSNSQAVNHVTGDVHYLLLVLQPSRTIVTVHDIGFYTNHPRSLKTLFKWLLWIYVLKRARKVVCISEFTKHQVLEHVRLRPNQVEVIQNPIPSEFHYVPKEFDAQCPRILHVGTGANKNLDRTIRALTGLNCHLRIVGRLKEDMKERLDASGLKWSNVFGISDEAMLQEYQLCDVVNFPSLFEGFGMPVIEGQAVGRVVVTSNREPMKGIAGPDALLVDPESEDSIRKAYRQVVNDGEFRDRIVQAGLANVNRFSAEAVFAQYNKLYQEILAEQKS